MKPFKYLRKLFVYYPIFWTVRLLPERITQCLLPYDWRKLKNSFEPIRSRADEYSKKFYENFWKDYPETQALFGRNMPKKELDVRINHVMVFLSENAGRPRVFVDYLSHLAARHKNYGIYEHQFEYVRETNIKTLNQLLPKPLTKEEERAWRTGFDFISWMMKLSQNFKRNDDKRRPLK